MEVLVSHLNENVIVIDAYELFTEAYARGEYCYFTTDHHVNLTGALLIYNEITKIIAEDYPELQFTTREDYNVQSVIVNGSFNRLIGQSVKADPEELIISLKKRDFTYTRTDGGRSSSKSIWGTGSSYANAYMDSDNPETVVITSNKEYPNILITGSSFTNILEVLCIPDCHTMASIDYRENKTGKSVTEYADDINAQYVIYVPSQSTNAHSIGSMKTHLGIGE
jgi:hypothetical protein